jgi:hypothetical protein
MKGGGDSLLEDAGDQVQHSKPSWLLAEKEWTAYLYWGQP